MSKVIELQAEIWEKEVIKSETPVVIDFWHQICGWCLKLNPIFDKLPEYFENVGVMGTPTIKIFCKGRDIGEMVGFRPIERLVSDLKEILDNKDECLEQSTPLE